MAEIIKTNGERITVRPKNGKDFKLEELKKIVDGYIEVLYLGDKLMVLNEEGKPLNLPVNVEATKEYMKVFGPFDVIHGNVLLCGCDEIK